MWRPTRVSSWTLALEYHLWQHPEDGCSTRGIICYAGGTLVVAAEDDIPTLEEKVNTALKAIIHWIESAGLNPATSKMEAVPFTHQHRFSPLLPYEGEGDKALYSLEILGVVAWWKTDIQGTRKVDSSQCREDCREHESTHVELAGRRQRLSIRCWQILPRWFFYMEPLSWLMPLMPRHIKEQRWFWEWRNEGRKVACLKTSPLFQRRPSGAILGKGYGVCRANLACVHCHKPCLHQTNLFPSHYEFNT